MKNTFHLSFIRHICAYTQCQNIQQQNAIGVSIKKNALKFLFAFSYDQTPDCQYSVKLPSHRMRWCLICIFSCEKSSFVQNKCHTCTIYNVHVRVHTQIFDHTPKVAEAFQVRHFFSNIYCWRCCSYTSYPSIHMWRNVSSVRLSSFWQVNGCKGECLVCQS